MMRAAVHTRYGPPEVVEVREVEAPVAGPGEVLVRVHVTTVNRTDCGFRAPHPWFVRFFSGMSKPKRQILGCEFAGEIEAVGLGVDAWTVGARVFGFTGDERFGAHAELLTMPADGALAAIPEGKSFADVAGATEGAHYALSGIRAAGIGRGHRVLVNGGTGAIGSAAIQLLKEMGAHVTSVIDTRHVELVRGLGADRVIDRLREDFTKDRERYDVVFDAVGKSSYGRTKGLLEPRGIYLSTDLGPWSMNPVLALTTPLARGRRAVFPIPKPSTREEVGHIAGLVASGAFSPLVDRRYPLDDIVEAYRYVETGQKVGNVLIDVAPPG
jgi:NADPH:quinone reductase-like Zn-dependent oxidoreductase